MKRVSVGVLAAGLMLAWNLARAEPPAAPEAGTTLVGEREEAVGLYLLPWKSEAPSDIDRPPALFGAAAGPVDPAQFTAQTAADEAGAAYRRVRLEPR